MGAQKIIFVIDDDEAIRDWLRELLELNGYEVRTFASAQEALRALRKDAPRPGLILVDLMMPGIDGIKFRQKQIADRTLRSIPVIMMSASAELPERILWTKVNAHCAKPLNPQELMAVIQRLERAA